MPSVNHIYRGVRHSTIEVHYIALLKGDTKGFSVGVYKPLAILCTLALPQEGGSLVYGAGGGVDLYINHTSGG